MGVKDTAALDKLLQHDLKRLSDTELNVLILHFYGVSTPTIAKDFGVSRQYIHKIIKQAKLKLEA